MQRLKILVATSPFIMAARIAGAGTGFLAQTFLAHLLSPEALGQFFAATSLATVLGLLATQGYPGVMQRFATRYRTTERRSLGNDFFSQLQCDTAAATVAFATIMVVPAFFLSGIGRDGRILILATALCMVSVSAFSIYAALALTARRFGVALLPETLLRPSIFLAAVWILDASAFQFSAGTTAAAFAIVSFGLALAQYLAVQKAFPVHKVLASHRLVRRWRWEARPLLVVLLVTNLFADVAILLTSPFLEPSSLGPFGIALKISMLVGFIVQVTHQIELPDLADANVKGLASETQSVLLRSTLIPVLVTLLALIGSIVWGERLLLFFGPAYPAAADVLSILIGAQLIRAIAGPSPMLLTLLGARATNATICVGICLVLLVANATLTVHFGMVGAGLAVVSSIVAWTGASAFVLYWQAKTRVDFFSVIPCLIARISR